MAQELIQRIWCDRCMAKGEHVEGRTVPTIVFGNQAPRELDLCPQCEADMVAPLLELLQEHGRRLPGDDTPDLVSCPDCGKEVTKRGLGLHRSQMHGEGQHWTKRERATQPPPAERDAGEFVCPDCGKDDWKKPSEAAVRMHRTRVHGYTKKGGDDA